MVAVADKGMGVGTMGGVGGLVVAVIYAVAVVDVVADVVAGMVGESNVVRAVIGATRRFRDEPHPPHKLGILREVPLMAAITATVANRDGATSVGMVMVMVTVVFMVVFVVAAMVAESDVAHLVAVAVGEISR